ncbi:3-deoxy-D-manno-octulosonic acid transferase, partial [Oceaniglobus roseus]|uniref:3-deoxy-D-manno-octulosonic acid transferase n=1 Tax=Oceaniglobus roseus TaxID=1737570 RepID=UPI000C7F58C5
MAKRSRGLSVYLALAAVSAPLWRLAMARRVRRGKEDPARLPEKFGRGMAPRRPGRVLWFHALSVGESLALLPLLARAAEDSGAQVLLTTSTRTSAEALGRVGLPAGVVHQMLPVDAAGPVRRFLDHWRPDVAVVSELDLWPCLLSATAARGIPLALINSRMSAHNFAKRQRSPGLFGALLGLFEVVLVQNETSAERFAALGVPRARIEVLGPLKAAGAPLPCDGEELARLEAASEGRFRWLAASSERREAGFLAEAQRMLKAEGGAPLLILAPRNVTDGDGAEAAARARKLKVARRSRGEAITEVTDIYLADTIGEMGLFYRLAHVVFMGHSLSVPGPAQRGKNPFEAVVLDRPVLHGPEVEDFAETYAALGDAGGARCCADAAGLAAALAALGDPG